MTALSVSFNRTKPPALLPWGRRRTGQSSIFVGLQAIARSRVWRPAAVGMMAVNVDQLNTALAGIGPLASSLPIAASNQSALAAPTASGRNTLAIGYGASASATRSIAIGSSSVADQADTLSVGSVGAERRIVNVAPGVVAPASTDAVNGGQLFGVSTRLAEFSGGGSRRSSERKLLRSQITPSVEVATVMLARLSAP